MPTSAAQQKVTTGTSIKTMLQLATPSTRKIAILGWGYSLDAASSAVAEIELIEADTAATVTAHVAAGVQPLDAGLPASLLTLGITATGYTSSGEGSAPAAVRVLDSYQVPIAAGLTDLRYDKVFLPGRQPIISISKYVRLRVTFTSATNMACYIDWCE